MATTTETSSIKITANNLKKLIALIDSRYAVKATTLAGYGITDAATSAQGEKADSAIQKIFINGTEQTKTSDGSVNLSGISGSGNADAVQDNLDNHTSDTSNPHKVTKSQIGLGSVENKSSATIRGEITSSNVTSALGYTPLNSTVKGSANGVAELDENGLVPASQLPSYVDDVLEYTSISVFPETGESGKIYLDTDANKQYRWSGSGYAEISPSIALGETSSTAYRGDRGKIAYDHSQTAHAPSNAEANVQSDWNATDTSSDAYIKNKPTSLPANGGNADTVNGHSVNTDVPSDAVFTDTTYSEATTAAAGLMSATDKSKLNGIASGANAYTHPSYTARTGVPTANQTPAFGGTFSVSQPVSDGTGHITAMTSRTVKIPSTEATTSAAGLMSATDKEKLDGVATGANKTVVDSSLSTSSTNPLQNNVITAALNNKMDASDIVTTTISIPTSAWAADTTYSNYGYKATVANSSITAADSVSITLSVDSLAIAEVASISAGGETYAGGLYLYAKNIPAANLSGGMVIFKG